MTKTIVILGGGFAAMPIAHYLLKHTATKLSGGLKVVIVSPNTHVYWVFASVRGILPNMLPEDKLFYPIDEGFAKYPSGQFDHILGTADRLVPESNSVLVRRNDGAEQTISYDYVYVSDGLRLPPWSLLFADGCVESSQQVAVILTRRSRTSEQQNRPRLPYASGAKKSSRPSPLSSPARVTPVLSWLVSSERNSKLP